MSEAVAARPGARGGLWLGFAVLLLAANLRGSIVAVAPVLGEIRHDTGMSSAAAGLLTTVPVICFGAFAPLAAVLARRFGIEAALGGSMAVLATGVALRLPASAVALFAGTVVIGAAVAIGNTLLPTLTKRDFPSRIGLVTGLYVTSLSGGATLAAAATVPFLRATGVGWRIGLALWTIPALVAALVWRALPKAPREAERDEPATERPGRLLRSPLAWQVTLFMGLQSLSYFASAAWIPTIFESHGMSASAGGLLLALASLVGIAGALAAPLLAGRSDTQHALVVAVVALTAGGLLGLLLAPRAIPALWMVILGLGQGSALGLALTLIGLRAPDSDHTAELSGMAQTVGYLLAAVGPLALGALRDATGGFGVPLSLLLAVSVVELAAGLGASRNRHVERA